MSLDIHRGQVEVVRVCVCPYVNMPCVCAKMIMDVCNGRHFDKLSVLNARRLFSIFRMEWCRFCVFCFVRKFVLDLVYCGVDVVCWDIADIPICKIYPISCWWWSSLLYFVVCENFRIFLLFVFYFFKFIS